MQKKPTVTIGIPAYNEEANIANLLRALLAQEQKNLRLKEIIVVSDDSSDNTVSEVKSVKSKKIQLLQHSVRSGKSVSQNLILKNFNSDYLILLDADILPKNRYLIENLIKPFLKDKNVGLVGGRVLPLKPKKFLEKILFFSRYVKLEIFENINKGNNIYLCHGAVRAFSKKFAHQIRWPSISGEDAYSYLICISKGFKFYYEKKAEVYFKLPETFREHFNQSVRFLGSKAGMKKYFDEDVVNKNYALPKELILKVITTAVIKNPIATIFYFLIYCYANLANLFVDKSSYKWEMSPSTKNLVRDWEQQ